MGISTITCPKCDTEIEITEALAAPVIRQKVEEARKQIRIKEEHRAQEANVNRFKEQAEASGVISRRQDAKLDELTQSLWKKDQALDASKKVEAAAIRKERELDEAKRELELTIEKRITEDLAELKVKVQFEAEERMILQVREKELTISSMQKNIEDLKRKAEQGSQQGQGEALEIELEAVLRERFPLDSLAPVAKGVHGGDLIQTVSRPDGAYIGSILWEFKRTKNWTAGWLPKLRNDQREAKADVPVIVTQTLPEGVDSFDLIDGVWVCSIKAVIPVATVIRQALFEVATARNFAQGQETRAESIYQYVTGTGFKQRVQAIVEAFSTMAEDLNTEKKAFTKQWAKREVQIQRVLQATVGMYGDLQGIGGNSIPEIKGLEFKEF